MSDRLTDEQFAEITETAEIDALKAENRAQAEILNRVRKPRGKQLAQLENENRALTVQVQRLREALKYVFGKCYHKNCRGMTKRVDDNFCNKCGCIFKALETGQ